MKRASQMGFLLCFLGILAAVPLLIALRGADNQTSYYENRTLAAMPEYQTADLLSGAYFSAWDTWLTDHIPSRDRLLGLNTQIDYRLLQKPVVNDVVVAADVLLPFQTYGTWDLAYLAETADQVTEGLARLNETLETWGGRFYYLGVPLQSSYFYDRYPDYLENRKWHVDGMTAAFAVSMEEKGLDFLNMGDVFAAQGRPAGCYSASDHHFSYRGAFASYQAMMAHLNADTGWNLPVLTEEELTIVPAPNPFLGSRNRKLYGLWTGAEKLSIGVQAAPVPFTRTDNGAPVPATLYELPEDPAAEVTYDVYMGGDKAETILRTDRPELPNLLIFGDSFTNPLETLFYTGFNETRSLDLRYYDQKGILEYLEEYRPDVVICIRDDTAYLSTEGNGNIR